MPQITASLDGDAYLVTAVVGRDTHRYRVGVRDEDAHRFGASRREIARGTIAFLLDREPPTSILPAFDCAIVTRYFPEYHEALPGYLGAGPR